MNQIQAKQDFSKSTVQLSKEILTEQDFEKLRNKGADSAMSLDVAISNYLLGNTDLSKKDLYQLKDSDSPTIKSIAYSLLGHIQLETNPDVLSNQNYFLIAEKYFNQIETNDILFLAQKAENYYALGFYLKTHSIALNQAKTYYSKAIEIYEKINVDSKGLYDMKLGIAYNDLYILSKEDIENDAIFNLLEKAIHYKQKSLGDNPNEDELSFLTNSLKAIGNYHFKNNNYPAAIKSYKETINFIDSYLIMFKEAFLLKSKKINLLIHLSEVYQRLFVLSGDKENLKIASEYLILAEQIINTNNLSDLDLFAIRAFYYAKGTLLRNLDDYQSSSDSFSSCLEINDSLIKSDKGNIDFEIYKAHCFYELAITYSYPSKIKNCVTAKSFAKNAADIYSKTKESRKISKEYYSKSLEIINKCN